MVDNVYRTCLKSGQLNTRIKQNYFVKEKQFCRIHFIGTRVNSLA